MIAIAPPHGKQELINYKNWLDKRKLPYRILEKNEILTKTDVLLLCGGADVGLNVERDEQEYEWISQAISNNNYILGICKGMQIVNVALGGTLIEHIITETVHTRILNESAFHSITFQNGDKFTVNSRHHQSIDNLANGLVCVAKSDDKIVEAVVGYKINLVQWHPELPEVFDTPCEIYCSDWLKDILNNL